MAEDTFAEVPATRDTGPDVVVAESALRDRLEAQLARFAATAAVDRR